MSRTEESDSQATVATLFAGPGSASNSTSSVSENVGFRFVLDRTVQTLSSNGLPESGSFSGLLFVPNLSPQDPCNSIVSQYVPSNVTRYQDVTDYGYPIIGLAPWVTPECTQSFLSASREVNAEALVFFQPSSNDSGIPPPHSDQRWDLHDGDQWRKQNDYPIYAIPGPAGVTLMNELAWFSDGKSNHSSSDNDTSTDPSHKGTSQRLFTMLDTETPSSQQPGLWSFVLAILGTIVGLSLVLVVLYRFLQRRRRQILIQRIEAGQVDVERLAMSILRVPRDLVNKLPIYTYTGEAPIVVPVAPKEEVKEEVQTSVTEVDGTPSLSSSPSSSPSKSPPKVTGIRRPEPAVINPATDQPAPPARQHWDLQTSCAICLEEFVVGSSQLRELPCGHVFDPPCIDQYLIEQSSQCPLCKKSVLPAGSFQIPVTNALVRQEHAARNQG